MTNLVESYQLDTVTGSFAVAVTFDHLINDSDDKENGITIAALSIGRRHVIFTSLDESDASIIAVKDIPILIKALNRCYELWHDAEKLDELNKQDIQKVKELDEKNTSIDALHGLK